MSTTSLSSPALTPRAFLVRGLLVGVVAGLLAFAAGFVFGEPHVDAAIALEESSAAHGAPAGTAEDEASTTVVSRGSQRTLGLATGTVAIGAALGGFAGLAAAACVGRLGGLSARGTAVVVSLLGFVAISLVPFAKYPATPPAVGRADTIDGRTASYFALLLVSVVAVIAAVLLAHRLRSRVDGFVATVLAGGAYLVVVVAAGTALPAFDELGDFPADTLWAFRRGSLVTLVTLWAAIGVGLGLSVGRLHRRALADAERRALAASL